MPDKPKRKLIDWVRKISQEEMPIFGHTVQNIVTVSEDDDTSTMELSKVILQDASMTTRVLKLANSTYYNPREQSINTVSRAVIVLGFDTVRSLCLSIALVDAFVQGAPRDHLTRELARSIHAAVQARALAIASGDPSPEEVFIATLLYHLGELAYWCFADEEGETLAHLIDQPGYTKESAEEEVLGFRLRSLTTSLVADWKVNDLLYEVLKHPRDSSQRGRVLQLSHQLAEAAEQGWESSEVKRIYQALGEITGQSTKQLAELVHDNARESAHIASYFGAAAAAKIIPMPQKYAGETIEETDTGQGTEFPEPDGMLQLRILRDLAAHLDNGPTFNHIMEMVLEGIYRGIGLDRTVFALLSPDRKSMRAKVVLGHGREKLSNRFVFTRHPQQQNIFFELIDKGQTLWGDTQHSPNLAPFLSSAVASVIGKAPFFCAPIVVNGKSIGLLYGDRAISQRPLDEESYESFKHFTQQANLGLTHMTKGKN